MNDTKALILKTSKAIVQAQGYNALSFRELAKAIGVKSASIHYYFPTKADLGAALASQYADAAEALFLNLIEQNVPLAKSLQAYAAVFRKALEDDNRMCLCGIMAAERDALTPEVLTEVNRFTEINLTYLARLLGRAHPQLTPSGLRKRALAILSAVEGAQLMARSHNDISRFDDAIATYREIGLLA